MTTSCPSCGRQVEANDDGLAMPCEPCLLTPPSLEVLPEGATCATCGANVSLADYCEECEANR